MNKALLIKDYVPNYVIISPVEIAEHKFYAAK